MSRLGLTLILLIPLSAGAKIEKLKVKKVLKNSDRGIVMRPNGEEWLIEKGIGCLSFMRYEGKTVVGDYSIDPDSVGAKLLLPDEDQECKIWSGEKIE